MKKLFTLAAAVLASACMFAANPTTDDLAIISTDYTYTPTVALDKNSLYDDNHLLTSSNGNGYNNGLQIKENRWLAFKVAAGANVSVEFTEKSGRSMQLGSDNTTNKTSYGSSGTSPFAATITEGGVVYLTASSDLYMTKLTITFAADPTKAIVTSILLDGTKLAGFDADQEEYDVELDFGTTEAPEVTATTANGATVNITQAATLPGDAVVVCTSQDGTSETKTYTIHFTVAAAASDDATLKSLSVDGKALADFAANKFEYDVELEFDAAAAPEVTAEANESHASVLITPAEAIPGATTVVVTAQDGETKLTYTVNFSKETETPIIRATHVNGTTATVKGSIGGTADKKTQDNGKLGTNGHYFGITLADDKTFETGDSLVINLFEPANGSNIFIGLYEDKAGTTLLWNTGIETGVAGNNSVILPEALNGKATFYIVRPSDDNKWNGFIKSISVYRKEKESPTAIDNTNVAEKAVKVIENGQLVIIKNGVRYNAQGTIVR